MNNLEQYFRKVNSIGEFSKAYFSYLESVLNSIDENEINKLGTLFESANVKTEPGEYGPVEDAHLIMNHILAHWFQYYLRSGEMPYGVAKARTEDPIEWVIDMLERDYEQILEKLNVEDLCFLQYKKI